MNITALESAAEAKAKTINVPYKGRTIHGLVYHEKQIPWVGYYATAKGKELRGETLKKLEAAVDEAITPGSLELLSRRLGKAEHRFEHKVDAMLHPKGKDHAATLRQIAANPEQVHLVHFKSPEDRKAFFAKYRKLLGYEATAFGVGAGIGLFSLVQSSLTSVNVLQRMLNSGKGMFGSFLMGSSAGVAVHAPGMWLARRAEEHEKRLERKQATFDYRRKKQRVPL